MKLHFEVAFLFSSAHAAYRRIDGTGNGRNDAGCAETMLLRKVETNYPGDGMGEDMHWPDQPNPRNVSNTLMAQSGSHENDRCLTNLVWLWGQFLDHDITLTPTNHSDKASIQIEDPEDPFYLSQEMPFERSVNIAPYREPREQINMITAFIDASNVYGSDEERAKALRTFKHGKMKTTENGLLLPYNIDGFPNAGGEKNTALYFAGDERANEQVALTAMHTLFVREHNRLATKIAKYFRWWSDEKIYQWARKLVGAQMQIITYNEFLPALMGPFAPTLADHNHDRNIDAGITNEFATFAYRFGHSMLPEMLISADNSGATTGELSLKGAFFNPDYFKGHPERVGYILKGFASTLAQEIDHKIVDDVRNFLFGPPGAGGLDLASLNIQRGRDHGMAFYNEVRKAYHLSPASEFSDISSDTVIQEKLKELYGKPDKIDAWVAALAEDHVPGASMGELMIAVLRDQFIRLRDGDRFFFLNDPALRGRWRRFHRVRQIINLDRSVSLRQVIRRNTDITEIQRDVFFSCA